VKRWLTNLRGKDMPDSFAWSYKRRYKNGYVWQDLTDDDLITPTSDDEYVLKGSSDISAVPFDPSLSRKAKISYPRKPVFLKDRRLKPSIKSNSGRSIQLKSKSDLTNDHSRVLYGSDTSATTTNKSISLSSPDVESKMGITATEDIVELDDAVEDPEKRKPHDNLRPSFTGTKRRSYSRGASNVLRNLLNCRIVDTNDSAIMTFNRTYSSTSSRSDSFKLQAPVLGKSHALYGGSWHQPHHQRQPYDSRGAKNFKKPNRSVEDQKKVSAAYKPVSEPSCSQCRKSFKPEKLYTHMKSCKGLKRLNKTCSSATEKMSSLHVTTDTAFKEETISFLTQ
ncbi:hypothetical protein GIB67_023147, partial [Kingdonia uniflora]